MILQSQTRGPTRWPTKPGKTPIDRMDQDELRALMMQDAASSGAPVQRPARGGVEKDPHRMMVRIPAYLSGVEEAPVREIAEVMGLSTDCVSRWCHRLRKEGKLVRLGAQNRAIWRMAE